MLTAQRRLFTHIQCLQRWDRAEGSQTMVFKRWFEACALWGDTKLFAYPFEPLNFASCLLHAPPPPEKIATKIILKTNLGRRSAHSEKLLRLLSRKCRDFFFCFSNLPGNFALKNGGDFWGIFSGLRFPRNKARKILENIGENSEQNSAQNPGPKFEKFGNFRSATFLRSGCPNT